MPRPVILYSGQWTDLPLEELSQKASEWGYQGLELACWGDHFEVQRALSEEDYCPKKLELLSKYDLTKFNPWYWSRLKKFADLADERGLVLFNENYFQHNIIEAGAHWVDCPWRAANNINDTGFPEPPPFVFVPLVQVTSP